MALRAYFISVLAPFVSVSIGLNKASKLGPQELIECTIASNSLTANKYDRDSPLPELLC